MFYLCGAHLAATFSISPQNYTHFISHGNLLTVCRSSKQQHFHIAHEHFITHLLGTDGKVASEPLTPQFQQVQLIQRIHFLLKSALRRGIGEKDQDSHCQNAPHVNCQPKLIQNQTELILFLIQPSDGFPPLGHKTAPVPHHSTGPGSSSGFQLPLKYLHDPELCCFSLSCTDCTISCARPFPTPIHQHLKLALDQNTTQAHLLLYCLPQQTANTPLFKSNLILLQF